MNGIQDAGPKVQHGLVDLGTIVLLHAVQVGEGFIVRPRFPVIGETLQDHFFIHEPTFQPKRSRTAAFSAQFIIPVLFLESLGDHPGPSPGSGKVVKQPPGGVFQVSGNGVFV